jgi:hypothetical protein
MPLSAKFAAHPSTLKLRSLPSHPKSSLVEPSAEHLSTAGITLLFLAALLNSGNYPFCFLSCVGLCCVKLSLWFCIMVVIIPWYIRYQWSEALGLCLCHLCWLLSIPWGYCRALASFGHLYLLLLIFAYVMLVVACPVLLYCLYFFLASYIVGCWFLSGICLITRLALFFLVPTLLPRLVLPIAKFKPCCWCTVL